MKNIVMLLSLCLIISCSTHKSKSSSNPLDGTWIPTSQELGGKSMPKSFYEKIQLIISGNQYTTIAESIDKGVIKYSHGKMDIYGKEGVNAGKHFTAIYKLENDQLTICYNMTGDKYPESFETSGNRSLFLSIFQKKKQ